VGAIRPKTRLSIKFTSRLRAPRGPRLTGFSSLGAFFYECRNILCLQGIETNRNHVSLIDIFDSVTTPGAGAIMEQFTVVSAMWISKGETGQHRFSFLFKDWDGNLIIPASTEIVQIASFSAPSTNYYLQCVMGAGGLLRVGEYSFSLESEGKTLAQTPLYVLREGALR